jgi:hypothetical protein
VGVNKVVASYLCEMSDTYSATCVQGRHVPSIRVDLFRVLGHGLRKQPSWCGHRQIACHGFVPFVHQSQLRPCHIAPAVGTTHRRVVGVVREKARGFFAGDDPAFRGYRCQY